MNKIVEAVVRTGGRRVPVGLVNVRQALEMTEGGFSQPFNASDLEFSHPAYEAGKTDIFVSREMLSTLA